MDPEGGTTGLLVLSRLELQKHSKQHLTGALITCAECLLCAAVYQVMQCGVTDKHTVILCCNNPLGSRERSSEKGQCCFTIFP